MGICALCRKEKELQLSHIIPKFAGKYLKQTSVGNIRSQENPNEIIQDIEKHYLLCYDCEELFSANERYFANNIFYPYHREKQDTFNYNEQLFYFITSLSWRSLYLDIVDFVKEGDLKLSVLEKMISSEQIMRDFLLKNRTDIGNIEHHIFFFDRIKTATAPEDNPYITCNPHRTIHRSLGSYSGYMGNTIYTFSNLMGIIIVTLYEKDDKEEWTGTQIFNKAGTVYAKNQGMKSYLGGELQHLMQQGEEAFSKLNQKSKEKITSNLQKVGEKIKDYAIYQDFIDDYQIKENNGGETNGRA